MLQLLSRKVDRESFHCGNAELDDYLRTRARQDMKRRDSTCWVWVDESKPEEIIGYFTLSNLSINRELLLPLGSRSFYPSVPMTLLGRLAVSVRHQGKGIGQLLVALAIKLTLSGPSATHGLVVDMKDESLFKFYSKLHFQQMPKMPNRAVLLFEVVDLL